jgi:hypothetical protein
MANLTMAQLIADAQKAGFTGSSANTISAIAEAESGGNPLASNTVGNSAGTDRGVLEINSFYHSEVSNACAFDPQCAFDAAFTISSGGTNFTPWTTFTSGAYQQFLNNSGISSSGSTSSVPTTTTSLPGTITAANVQDFLIQGLFIVGGLALVIMGFILAFKTNTKKLPV